jgi:hypothetical protein
MHLLSEKAASVLGRMEPQRSYEPSEIRAWIPGTSLESLREIMHELWVKRYVERHGFAGWRLERSTSGVELPTDRERVAGQQSVANGGQELRPAQTKAVRPEDLFDHEAFSDFFR